MFKRIQSLRLESNYTNEFVANYLEMTPEEYLKIESGKSRAKTIHLIKLARLYNTSIDYIVNETDVKEKHKYKWTYSLKPSPYTSLASVTIIKELLSIFLDRFFIFITSFLFTIHIIISLSSFKYKPLAYKLVAPLFK